MWGFFLLPLLALCFLAGLAIAIGIFLFRRPATVRGHVALALLPFATVALPISALLGLMLLGSALQPDDADLFEELYGRETSLRDDQMLFDDFYSGASREIWMRAEVSGEQRNEVLAIPGLEDSALTLGDIAAKGASHGFYWWVEPENSDLPGACLRSRIRKAKNAMGWREVLVAECFESIQFGERLPDNNIYVFARGSLR